MNTAPTINIVMADDHEIFRDGFRLLFSRQTDIVLLAEAENGKELIELVRTHQPDIVITDIKMPILDGIETTKQIAAEFPGTGIIGLSMYDEDDLIVDMLEAGARGFLLKNAGKEQIKEAIKTVYEGDPYYCKTTSNRLTQMIAKSKFNPYKSNPAIEFTEREKEIIVLISKELSNKEIAETLFLSARTVEGHRQNIMDKMDVKNTVGLVIYAIKKGLVKI